MGQEQRFNISDCLYTSMMAINKTQMDVSVHSGRRNSEAQGRGERAGACTCAFMLVDKEK